MKETKTFNAAAPDAGQEERLRAMLAQAYPAASPSPDLHERVAERVRQRQDAAAARRRPAWTLLPPSNRTRIGFAVAAGAALTVTSVALWPKWVAAETLRRVQAAVEGIQVAHSISWELDADGRRTKKREMWLSGEKTRSEESEVDASGQTRLVEQRIFADGKSYVYDPLRNRVTVRRQKSYAHFKSSGFTIAAMRRDSLRWGWKDSIRDLGVTTVDGRPARQVVIERNTPGHPERTTLFVDPHTDLPFRAESQVKDRGEDRWVTQTIGELEYNAPISPRLFAPDTPRGAVVIDEDAGRKRWEARLARPIAEKTVADGRRIAIRDVEVNRNGTVFVLYTAGKRLGDRFLAMWPGNGRDWRYDVTDNLGTKYVWSNQEMLMDGPPEFMRSRVYDGERLEEDAWVPLTHPQQPWQPRRFTITFHASAENMHGEGGRGKPDLTETATFTVPVRRAADALAPEFAQYVALDIDEKTVEKLEASARGELPPGVKPSPELMREFLGGNGIAFSPDGRTLGGSIEGGDIGLWDVEAGSLRRLVTSGTGNGGAGALAFSPDGARIAFMVSAYDSKKRQYTRTDLEVRDVRNGRALWSQPVPTKREGLGSLTFSRDGTTLAATGYHADETTKGPDGEEMIVRMSGRLQTWDARTGEKRHRVSVPEGCFHPALSPTLDRMVTIKDITAKEMSHGREYDVLKATEVKVWDAHTGALVRPLDVPEGMEMHVVKVSPDGSLIVAGGAENNQGHTAGGAVLVWDAKTGRLLHTLRGKGFMINDIEISPTGDSLAVAGGEDYNSVDVWNPRTGRKVTTLIGHGKEVREAEFSPDGNFLATSDLSNRILLWRVSPAP